MGEVCGWAICELAETDFTDALSLLRPTSWKFQLSPKRFSRIAF